MRCDYGTGLSLTIALASGPSDSLSRLLDGAGLTGAVTDAVCPIALVAEAGNVTSAALELGRGDGGHVVNAELLGKLAFITGYRARWSSVLTAHVPRAAWAEAAPMVAARTAKDFILNAVEGERLGRWCG